MSILLDYFQKIIAENEQTFQKYYSEELLQSPAYTDLTSLYRECTR